MKNLTDGLIGLAVGDALGVPVEFLSQEELDKKPVKSMLSFGTHNQPAGTWSDDSSLAFCLAESLTKGYDLKDIALNLVKWQSENFWTARGEVFDIGITTNHTLNELRNELNNPRVQLENKKYAGTEKDNGNGSLMRIFPLLPEFIKTDKAKRFEKVWNVSALTHKHIRAAIACYIYLVFCELLFEGKNLDQAYTETRNVISIFFKENNIAEYEIQKFDRIIKHDIRELKRAEILSGGYVIETIEAAFWCILTTDNFEKSVLRAVNLGHDTDTTGAVTGAVTGFYYGLGNIPEFWVVQLAKMEEIIDLGKRLSIAYKNEY